MRATVKTHGRKATPHKWYLDSRASEHFSPHKDLFDEIQTLKEAEEIETVEGNTVYGIGKGSIQITAIVDDKSIPITLTNVIYTPEMSSNLLSTSIILDLGFKISMKPDQGVNIFKDGRLIVNTVHEGKLYRLKIMNYTNKATIASTPREVDITVWHRCLGHMEEEYVWKLASMADGINITVGSKLDICKSCLEGKQHRQPSREPIKNSQEPLGLIHSDTSGLIDPTAIDGITNYGTFMDDATKMTAIVPLKTKTAKEMLEQFKDYQAIVEKQLGRKIKYIRTDGGGGYEKEFDKYLKSQGILHEATVPYSPEQNGVAERVNRTIMERTRSILVDAKLPKELWMEVAKTVVYLKNRSPTSALSTTPYEAWYGTKPDLSHLRITGSPAYVLIPKEKRVKLDSHSIKGQLIG
jgi:hypothetical protein